MLGLGLLEEEERVAHLELKLECEGLLVFPNKSGTEIETELKLFTY